MKRRANGEGAVYERADGRWEAKVRLDGRRPSVYGATQREALEKRAELLRAHVRGGAPAIASERQTLGEYIASWLPTQTSQVRPTTFERYEQFARIHVTPDVARIPLAKLGAQHLEALYATRLRAGSAPRTVKHVHNFLHGALEDAVRWGLVARNVADIARPPRVERHRMRTFTEGELRSFLAAAEGQRQEALFVLAATTAMRQGELLALRWQDLDLDAGYLQVRQNVAYIRGGYVFLPPKTARSRRRIDLTKVAIAALRQHRVRQLEERFAVADAWEDLDLVFPNEVGRPVEGGNLAARDYRRVLERAQLPRIRFHDLRHTAISIPLAKGVNPKVVSEMAGHSSVAFTMDTYAHVMPTMHRDAAAVFDAVIAGTA